MYIRIHFHTHKPYITASHEYTHPPPQNSRVQHVVCMYSYIYIYVYTHTHTVHIYPPPTHAHTHRIILVCAVCIMSHTSMSHITNTNGSRWVIVLCTPKKGKQIRCVTRMNESCHTFHTNERVAVCCARPHCSTLQHTAMHGNPLLPTATHCNPLQPTATHCNPLQPNATSEKVRTRATALKHMEKKHNNTLQHTVTLGNTQQHTATHCNTLQSQRKKG